MGCYTGVLLATIKLYLQICTPTVIKTLLASFLLNYNFSAYYIISMFNFFVKFWQHPKYDVILVVSEVILEERVHNRVAVTYMTSAKIPLHKYCYLEADNDFSFLRQPIKYSTKSCPRIGKPIYSAKNVYIILCKIKK